VGAKSGYIRKPFLIQSIFQGAVSALIGLALLMTLFFALNNLMESFEISYTLETFLLLSASLLVIGVVITLVSTWFALNKYLRMKLDDLY
jgi:cell division transport system permease protein